MPANIRLINAKIDNYIASHPELKGKGRDYVISIMIKDFAFTEQEAKLLELPSIYSDFSVDKEYVSPLASDNFVKTTTDEIEPDKKENNQENSFITKEHYTNNNSRVNNKYYQGSAYSVKQNDNYTLTVINKDTQNSTTVDLKEICKNVPLRLQPQFFEVIQKLPGEVLEDIANEASFSVLKDENDNNGRSYFNFAKDTIKLSEQNIDEKTILHELGHAIDFIYGQKEIISDNMYISPPATFTSETSEIEGLYNQELSEYIKSGNPIHVEEYIPVVGTNEEVSFVISEGPYCTRNVTEFFAESYCLMMIGESADEKSKECIEKYFPKTFAAVKAELVKIRKKPLEERH